jgi:chromosome segregation ATPase
LQQQIDTYKAEAGSWKSRVEDLQQQEKNLQEQLQQSAKLTEELQQGKAKQEETLDAVRIQINSKDQNLETVSNRIAELEAALHAVESKAQQAEAAQNVAELTITEQQSELETVRQRLAEVEAKAESAQGRTEEAYDRAKAGQSKAAGEIHDLNAQIEKLACSLRAALHSNVLQTSSQDEMALDLAHSEGCGIELRAQVSEQLHAATRWEKLAGDHSHHVEALQSEAKTASELLQQSLMEVEELTSEYSTLKKQVLAVG